MTKRRTHLPIEHTIEPFAKLETALYEVPAPEDASILPNSMAKAIDEGISRHNLVPPQIESVSSFAKGSIRMINQWYQGWASYFKMTQYPSQLVKIEAHIRRRLRARFVRQQKRRSHLYHKLISLGVSKAQARVVYSNRNTWALSHTKGVEQAYSNHWFRERMQLKILSDKQFSWWFAPNIWVRLI